MGKLKKNPLDRAVNRRRVLSLFAIGAGAGAGLLGARSSPTLATTSAVSNVDIWEGQALGGDASIQLLGFSPQDRARLQDQCVAHLRALEQVFSLFDPESDLVRLNQQGQLHQAPQPLLELLRLSKHLHGQTGGAFDPTVQPLWQAAAHHFQSKVKGAYQPHQASLSKVGFEHVQIDGKDITLAGGAELTLNGIAQGYITDQITELLQRAGARHVLVNLGEFRALGPNSDGQPWQIGVRDPGRIWHLLKRLPLSAGAIATSAASGQQFDAAGYHHHLFDPATGQNTQRYKSVSVWAPTATRADGLSTAFTVMAQADIEAFVDTDTKVGVLLQHKNGRLEKLGNWSASAPS
ncbi:MAG: FAD:protein FMN transferase [Parvibaculaceae bacterium]|nr:FAD:protein FMN transferase [Parvibaculaceae bacterium]